MADTVHIAIPATGEYRKWAEVAAASAKEGSSLPVEVHFIDWSVIDRERLESLGSWHGSAIAFSRLYLAELFPDLDWVVTCDADVLFRGDIAELWKLRDDSVAFIAHKDCPLPPQEYTQSHFDWYGARGLDIKDWNRYFADGLGLVNLKRWREKGYQESFERLAKEYRDWPSPDMMILNYVLQDDCALLPVEWDCFSGDENADVDWSRSGAVHFVEDTPWRRWKITHLASDLVEEWWDVAERIGVAATCRGFHGCRNILDWVWRRLAFLFFKHSQWLLRLHFKLWLHLRSTRGVDARPASRRTNADVLHVVPGLAGLSNGIAAAARMIAASQGADIVEARWFARNAVDLSPYSEVWVHSCWTPMVWKSCCRVLRAGKPPVRMMHGNLDPVRLKYHGWKKWLVGPIERFCLRRAKVLVATCEAEKEWIQSYLGKHCPPVEVIDIKRFFKLSRVEVERGRNDKTGQTHFIVSNPPSSPIPHPPSLHILYLGRRHPLKGVEYLEKAVAELNSNPVNPVEKNSTRSTFSTRLNISAPPRFRVRIVTSAFGEELEKVWDWCDVLVLPTLSENFGLVVAEALERGKRVITTDGAPAWGDGNDYGGRLVYLKGYRDGSPEERVRLLKGAIERMGAIVCVSH